MPTLALVGYLVPPRAGGVGDALAGTHAFFIATHDSMWRP